MTSANVPAARSRHQSSTAVRSIACLWPTGKPMVGGSSHHQRRRLQCDLRCSPPSGRDERFPTPHFTQSLRNTMNVLIVIAVAVVALFLLAIALGLKIIKQYEQGVLFRLGRVLGVREPGLRVIIPFVDVLHRVSLRIITMPIQSQGIITRDNVSVDVSAVVVFREVAAAQTVGAS